MPRDDHDDLKSPRLTICTGDISPERLAALQTARSTARAIILDSDVPSKGQLVRMFERYRAVIAEWQRINGAGTHAGADKIERAMQCCDTALGMLSDDKVFAAYADIRQLVGIVQGIMYTVGLHTWEYLASDDTRK